MVARTPTETKLNTWQFYSDAVYSFTLTQNDTFTLTEFVDTENLKFVAVINKSTGAEITCTYAALNVVTVTGACTDAPCRVYAFGVKA